MVFTPSGLSGAVPAGTTVLDAARMLGVDLDSVCGGRGICGRCQMEPSFGEFTKWRVVSRPEHLGAWTSTETEYRTRKPLADSRRLGCAARIDGDVVIDVPATSQVHRPVVRKSIDVSDLVVDPIFSLHYLVPENDVDLAAALASQWGITVTAGTDPLTEPVTAVIRDHDALVTVWPGFADQAVGVAVDIGSTTIAGHLCDLATGEVLASAGRMNPQIRFGEDLMSRVSYVMMNPGGDVELTTAVRSALDELIGELVDEAAVEREHLLDVVLVGNPIMHHLVLGIDPTPLGQAPFPLAVDGAVHRAAVDLDLHLPNASVYVGPCVAGHVGADTSAAILAEGPYRSDATQLLVDVGTNAEIVLGSRRGLFAASSPTGPAFEGAQITCGQRATAGAIERVRIDPTTLEPRFTVIGCDLWSDDDGFDAATSAGPGVTGICGSGIIEVISELVIAGVVDANGLIVASAAERSRRVVADGRTFAYVLYEELRITQADIRAVQLAKAALRAGIELLLAHAGLTSVDEIRLAGAFGAHIDPAHAMVLGLIPEAPLDTVRSVGNAAGTGAVRALLSAEQRGEMEEAVRHVTKIETATEPRFQELFVAALGFPRSTAPIDTTSPRGRRRTRTKELT